MRNVFKFYTQFRTALAIALATATLPGSIHAQSAILEGGGSLAAEPLNPPFVPAGATRFTRLSPEQSGIVFENRYDDPEMWGKRYREFSLGSVGAGIAIGDFDSDGKPDIYAVSKTGPNKLFRQSRSLVFTDITATAGVAGNPHAWCAGVTAVDIDNNGLLDLYVCYTGAPNMLFVNQGDGRFAEEAADWGLAIADASVMGAFSDYDRDGDLDLYLLTNILDYRSNPHGQPDYLLRNNGNGSFTDVTRGSGISGAAQGHAATWWDFNHDGWPDLHVTNDFDAPDRLYRNNRDGTLSDVLTEALPLSPYFSMGSDLGDVNNDGLTDFFVGDMAATTHEKDMTGIAEIGRGAWESDRSSERFPMLMRNAFYLNTGAGRFAEIAHLNRLDASDWTWATRFADLDNNGWTDLFITNGNVRNFMEADLLEKQNVTSSLAARISVYKSAPPYKERNLAFRNDGNLLFADVSSEWGLDHLGISFGAAFSDLDRDGDLDIVVNNYQENLSIYRNDANFGGLLIQLKGVASNAFGIGAAVTSEQAAGRQAQQLTLARGLLSSDEPILHFGDGGEAIQSITIAWPSGHEQVVKQPRTGFLYTVSEPAGPAVGPAPAAFSDYRDAAQFAEVSSRLGLSYLHQESKYNDFAEQLLLPRRLSRDGPALAWRSSTEAETADQLIVGGAAGHPTSVFDFRNGRFSRASAPEAFANRPAETLGLAALDSLLYAANGGVEGAYADHAYRLPTFADMESLSVRLPDSSTSTVAAADFDGDGDLDIFVGGHSIPGSYPEAPRSYLLENRNGALIDVTDAIGPDLVRVGMVTSALWSDADNDGDPDLLLAMEWGSITLFRNEGGQLRNATVGSGLELHTGWWHSIAAGDLNNDGWLDYAVGNAGLNTKYIASAELPTQLYYGDLDGSGKRQIVEAQHSDLNRNLYPIRPYSKLRFAFPSLAAKFESYRGFAQATLAEIFSPDRLAAAKRLEANTLASGVYLSNGDGTFTFRALPRSAQIAPIFGMAAQDFDGDGQTDLYVVQNSFAREPSTGPFNGGLSQLLLGDGAGNLTPVSPAQSGLVVDGDAKALVTADFQNDGWADCIVAQNGGPLLAFENRGRPERHSFSVALDYRDGSRHGFGARIVVHRADGSQSMSEITSHAGYLSQSQPKVFFGYTEANMPTEIVVRWPDGSESRRAFAVGEKTIRIKR